MSLKLTTYDDLLEFRRLASSAHFQAVDKTVQREIARLETALYNRATDDAQALKLRAAIIEMRNSTPAKVLEQIIRNCEALVQKANKEAGYPARTL